LCADKSVDDNGHFLSAVGRRQMQGVMAAALEPSDPVLYGRKTLKRKNVSHI